MRHTSIYIDWCGWGWKIVGASGGPALISPGNEPHFYDVEFIGVSLWGNVRRIVFEDYG